MTVFITWSEGACSQLGLWPHRSFDFLGTVHAMQRQHTSGRELFMNGEIRDCTASPGVVRIYFLADSHVRNLRELYFVDKVSNSAGRK